MPTAAAAPTRRREPDPPDPRAIVLAYPNPVEIIRAYLESDFARQLATEHERKVAILIEEGTAVTDHASYARVGDRLVDVAGHRKIVEAWFKPITDFAHQLHKVICDRRNQVLEPLTTFEFAGKRNRLELEREDERRRQEEQRRLEEAARRDEQERLAREAEAMADRGEPELADQILEQAIHAPTPVFAIQSTLPKTQGIGKTRENWKWRPIGGDTAQGRARAEKIVPREYLELSEKKLNAYAKAHGAGARIPGIEFYDAGSVSVRS